MEVTSFESTVIIMEYRLGIQSGSIRRVVLRGRSVG